MAKKKPSRGRTTRTPKKAPRKRTAPDWAPAFLDALAETGSVRAACVSSGVGRSTVYERRDNDQAFAAAMRDALDDSCDDLDLEARRRALQGVEEPVFGSLGGGAGSGLIGTVTKYSDSLLMFLLKAHRPHVYRDSVKVQGDPAAPIQHSHSGQVDHDHRLDPGALSSFAQDLVAAGLGDLSNDGGSQPVDTPPAAP